MEVVTYRSRLQIYSHHVVRGGRWHDRSAVGYFTGSSSRSGQYRVVRNPNLRRTPSPRILSDLRVSIGYSWNILDAPRVRGRGADLREGISIAMQRISGMSPAAQARRKRGLLIWGLIILIVWLLISLGVAMIFDPVAPNFLSAFMAGQVFGFLFFIVGAILFLIGLLAEIRARIFNAHDIARAKGLNRKLAAFSQYSRAQLYEASGDIVIEDAKIIEIERHFDQQTEGAITGTLETSMHMFSTSYNKSSAQTIGKYDDRGQGYVTDSSRTTSWGKTTTSGTMTGTSIANFSLSQTTRANLMGDALFAVFEINGNDTYRVVSMSAPGVKAWMGDLIMTVAEHFGGYMTHSGQMIAAWIPSLTHQFGPQDVSYATDRLKVLAARPYEDREAVSFEGTAIGRNAMIATHIRIGAAEPLEMLPVAFPGTFGRALGSPEPLAELTQHET